MPPLHHVALGARDVLRVAAFYRDLLGLRELGRHYDEGGELRSIWLDLGGPVLMVERTAEAARRVEGVGSGPFLLALEVDPEERSALEARLCQYGHPVDSRTTHSSYFRDPEDNRVAISHYRFDRSDRARGR